MSIDLSQENMRKLANLIVERMSDEGYFRTCCNCKAWDEQHEVCKKYNVQPPARVIVKGCEDHSDNIPF